MDGTAGCRPGSRLPGRTGEAMGPPGGTRPAPGHLGGAFRGKASSLLGERAPGWARRGGGAPPRLPRRELRSLPDGLQLSARTLRMPPPGFPAGSAWRLSCSCGPTRGYRRDSRANVFLGRGGGVWGDVGLSPAGEGGLCPAPRCYLRRLTRGVGAGGGVGRGPPTPHQGPRWGLPPCVRGGGGERGGKGRAVSRGRGASSRGGWAVPTCARGQAPAPRRDGGSPALRAPSPAPLFPLDCPQTALRRQRNPPAPRPPRKRWPRGAARGPARRPRRDPLPA